MHPIENRVIAEWKRLREGVGIWRDETFGLARISGNEAASWLQPQLCNDVLALDSGMGHHNALLDRKGRIQAHFTLYHLGDDYLLLTERERLPVLFEQFESVLFLEEVTFSDETGSFDFVVLQGPRTALTLAALSESNDVAILPAEPCACVPLFLRGVNVLALRRSVTGGDGYVLLVEKGQGSVLTEALTIAGAPWAAGEVGMEAREIARIEAGIPRWGVDMDRNTRISETPLEPMAVSYSKGCYLGQEVVAKLKHYAGPGRALAGLVFAAGLSGPLPRVPIRLDGRLIGTLTSSAWSPSLQRFIALAYLDRKHRPPGVILDKEGDADTEAWQAEVVTLPFVPPFDPVARAQQLYNEALDRFEQDREDRDSVALERLREAILLVPDFEDAYETLGVMLHRQGLTDEAITVMNALVRINPDCLMAHTNLSVFYVSKGLIREAEEEKALASAIERKQNQATQDAAALAEAERTQIQREAGERIQLFEEVLELDPNDPLATYGCGMAYIQLGQPEQAISFLERAIQCQKDYSAAYRSLGRCLEQVGRLADARAVYSEGIAAASRKGDLMPLREMENRLAILDRIDTASSQSHQSES